MAKNVFEGQTDGLRGLYGSEPIDPESFKTLAAALVETTGADEALLVGGDTRVSTPELKQAVTEGAMQMGVKVVDMGNPAPTPSIAFTARRLGIPAVAITASHNPGLYNGFKPFDAQGDKIHDAPLFELGRVFEQFKDSGIPRESAGGVTVNSRLGEIHVEHIIEIFGPDSLRDKTVVLDMANGAAHRLAPMLFEGLGATVYSLGDNPHNPINHRVGATNPDGLISRMAALDIRGPDFIGGFTFDGDADRVLGVDQFGRVVDGHYWMLALAEGQTGIVGTDYTSGALEEHLSELGIDFTYCRNGDIEVTNKLRELGLTRGGEVTGHLIDTHHLSSGDGLYMAAFMAVHLARNRMTLVDMHDKLEIWKQIIENVDLPKEIDVQQILHSETVGDAVSNLNRDYGDKIRTLIRPSGTEPVIRVFAEAEDPEVPGLVVARLVNAISNEIKGKT